MANQNLSSPLKILCVGAGAIGTYLGGSLLLTGHRVRFLERPHTVNQIKQLHLRLSYGTYVLHKPEFSSDIGEALDKYPFDLIIFALKSFDTDSILETLLPYQDQIPPILALQNGVENEERITSVLGKEKVIPATVTSAVGKNGPGDIALEKFRGVGISALHPLSARLKVAFNQANLNAHLYENPTAMKWSKMLTNLVANATSAILGVPPAIVYTQPGVFSVELDQLRETLSVMEALDIPVVDLPGTPVRLLAGVIRSLPAVISRPLLKKAVIGGRGDKMPSFFIDLTSGRTKTEVEYLNGAVTRAGKRCGVPTPANAFLTDTLTRMVSGELPKDLYKGNFARFVSDYRNFSK